jgi:uroporphyrinogen decarboxylase
MRQAGRYLPEYCRVRERAGSFLDLCYSPDLAAEATLQPLRRFDLDAAIVFADILVVPHAMGLGVHFEEGEGPIVESVSDAGSVGRLGDVQGSEQTTRVCETIRSVRSSLPEKVAVIGFCGAPWTVASYMVGGGRPGGRELARATAEDGPDWFRMLIARLIEVSSTYLLAQVDAGADVLQIFDSWAGELPFYLQEELVLDPIGEIVRRVGEKRPDVPIIVFGRGLGTTHEAISRLKHVAGVSVEPPVSLQWARDRFDQPCAIQGNLDPVALERGGRALVQGVECILRQVPMERHIFNLGHGVRPTTPPERIAEAVALVRRFDENGAC